VKKEMVAGTTDSFEAMKKVRPAFVLKGVPVTDASGLVIVKAVPTSALLQHGNPSDIVLKELGERVASKGATVPRLVSGEVDVDMLRRIMKSDPKLTPLLEAEIGPLIKSNPALAGEFRYQIGGGAAAAAYWAYDETGKISTIVGSGDARSALSKAFAIDGSSEYQKGFLLVEIPNDVKASLVAAQGIRRPTGIDGIPFAEFANAPAGKFYGVTAGGEKEFMVKGIQLGSVEIKGVY
jgi:hypothetical protein